MLEVQDILEQYGEVFLQKHHLSHIQYKAWNAIRNCRTSRLGGHMDKCPNCGYEHPSYNSCRNRNCPKCQTFSKERWIDAQKADLLNVGYFHVVFTVPQELNVLIYRNQLDFYNLLFRCAAESLQELAGDKKYLGAQIGHTAVLHTWGQNLCFHPHIHCIVPSGGLTALGKWQSSRKKFFLPVRVLSRKFRGKFLALLKLQIPDIDQSLLKLCYKKEWVVYCKPPFKDASCVVEYLGRYTHRVAISNNRILKIENGTVTFKWRDYRDSSRWKIMTLDANWFTKIRHYGFLSSRGKQKKLKACKIQTRTTLIPKEKLSAEQLIQKLIGRSPSQCPRCGYIGLLRTGLAPPVASIA